MRYEQVFSKGGFYLFVVKCNAVLHKEAAESGWQSIANMLVNRTQTGPITILDLACGSMPISICQMAETFSDLSFDYTGIDINPDQVQQAKFEFTYPKNFCQVEILEGNAWELSELIKQKKQYDVIFTGMNLHHGVPEEIFCLMHQIKSLLLDQGIFINHDVYRPSHKQYIRRPECNPQNQEESYLMIPKDKLASYSPPDFNFSNGIDHNAPDWRLEFLDKYAKVLVQRGGDQEGIESTIRHVQARDFSLSTAEMKQVIESAGFKVKVIPYTESQEPLKDYYAMVVATKLS